jgi:Cu2+-containing amine oxidase
VLNRHTTARKISTAQYQQDWPIMPMTKAGLSLQPVGFFDRNPTLDIAPPASHCRHG